MEDIRVLQPLGNHAQFVHGGADTGDPAGGVDFADFAIARLLHGVDFFPAQKLHEKVIQEVCSRANKNVLRVHPHSPKVRKVPGNGLPQLRHPPVWQRQQQGLSVVQHNLPLEPHPHGEGKLLRSVGGQIQQPPLLLCRRDGFPGRFGGRRTLHRFHEVAHLLLRAQIPLGQKLVVGRFHGDLADLQILSQRPLGGQLLPGLQLAGEDIPPDTAVQRFVQRHAGSFFQFIGYHNIPTPGWEGRSFDPKVPEGFHFSRKSPLFRL